MKTFYTTLIIGLLIIVSPSNAVAKSKDSNISFEKLLYSFTYLLDNSPYVSPLDHLETSLLINYECGFVRDVDPLVGVTIAFHESWGIHDVRAEKTGDTGLMQIKPRYAYKPANYKLVQKYFNLAMTSKGEKHKKYWKLYSDAKKALYKDKYTVQELQDPAINVKVGCWSLKMWRDEWTSKKKGPQEYIAKYAGGSKPHARAWGFQKWVEKQVTKTEKRLSKQTTSKIMAHIITQSGDVGWKMVKKEFSKQNLLIAQGLKFLSQPVMIADNKATPNIPNNTISAVPTFGILPPTQQKTEYPFAKLNTGKKGNTKLFAFYVKKALEYPPGEKRRKYMQLARASFEQG